MTGARRTASVSGAMTRQTEIAPDRSRWTTDSDGMNEGIRVLSSLVAGVLLYGALGWVGDYFFGTRFLVAIGIVLGAGLGSYTTIRRLAEPKSATPTEGEQ